MAESNATANKNNEKNKVSLELLALDPSMLLTEQITIGDMRPTVTKQGNVESIIFIWFDPQLQSGLNLVGSLRSINHHVQVYDETSACINAIKSLQEKIFLITSSIESDLIAMMNSFSNIEAIFILTSNGESIKGDFSKLFGIFPQQEELFRTVKEVLELFEQIQFEPFQFEHEKGFLWLQLWKEELTHPKSVQKKDGFIKATRQSYHDNAPINRLIDDFDKSYRSNDILKWCVHSPFPSRYIHHALRSFDQEQLNVCRFLFTDAVRFFQKYPKRKEKVYRGMKLSNELLDKFKDHIGQFVCTNGFFPCMKSRANAITLASLPTYRTDLLPVLFKIDSDASMPCIEVTNKYSVPLMLFEIATIFRILYVNRDQITIIKMTAVSEAGTKIALDYVEKHKDQTTQSLLGDLTTQILLPKPHMLPPLRVKPRHLSSPKKDSTLTQEEIRAQKYIDKGDIDRALATYQRIQPMTARVLNAIGRLCAEKKEEYNYALECHIKALKMQEEANEDISETLTDLGNVYHNCNQFDLALNCHTRALTLCQSSSTPDSTAIAANLIGIANTHWARHEYPEAIDYTQRGLTLRENQVPPNSVSIAATLAMLGSIYQDCGNLGLALDLTKKALVLFESLPSTDTSILADLYYALGTIQLNTGLLDDAYRNYKQLVKIYRKTLPREHPDRLEAENDLQRVIELCHKQDQQS